MVRYSNVGDVESLALRLVTSQLRAMGIIVEEKSYATMYLTGLGVRLELRQLRGQHFNGFNLIGEYSMPFSATPVNTNRVCVTGDWNAVKKVFETILAERAEYVEKLLDTPDNPTYFIKRLCKEASRG